MSLGMSAVLKGLPGLIGVLAGILLYARPVVSPPPVIPALVLACCLAVLFLAYRTFPRAPSVARELLEPWLLSSIAIVALCTQLLLWLTVNAANWFELPDSELKAVSAALVGAVGTFLATAWIKEIQDSSGVFLPSAQFKGLCGRFLKRELLTGDTLEVAACDADFVPTEKGIAGWGFAARRERARILSRYLATGHTTPVGNAPPPPDIPSATVSR